MLGEAIPPAFPTTTEDTSAVRTYTPKPGEVSRAWHVIDATDVVLGRLASQTAQLLRGKHIGNPRVESVSVDKLVCRFEAPPSYETDGEWNRAHTAELTIECVPHALSVLVPGP